MGQPVGKTKTRVLKHEPAMQLASSIWPAAATSRGFVTNIGRLSKIIFIAETAKASVIA